MPAPDSECRTDSGLCCRALSAFSLQRSAFGVFPPKLLRKLQRSHEEKLMRCPLDAHLALGHRPLPLLFTEKCREILQIRKLIQLRFQIRETWCGQRLRKAARPRRQSGTQTGEKCMYIFAIGNCVTHALYEIYAGGFSGFEIRESFGFVGAEHMPVLEDDGVKDDRDLR